MRVDTSNKTLQRNFGLVLAAGIAILGLIRWIWHGFGAFPWWFFYIAAGFLVVGLAVPRVLQPLLVVWLAFGLAMNWVMTRVLLTVAFFVLFIPVRVILLLAKKDPLNRAWDPNAPSYWEEAEEQPKEFERYLNQF
jgi:hypothetical protein